LIREDAAHEYSSRALPVKIPIDETEGFGLSRDASGLDAVTREFPSTIHPKIGILQSGPRLGSEASLNTMTF
jgi:hypothetical protein